MVKNRDARKGYKLKTRQRKIAGKFAFHRVDKLIKSFQKIVPWAKNRKNK